MNIYQDDITVFFRQLAEQSGGYDIAIAEFERMVNEDDHLHDSYSQWCEENGYSERDGFAALCNSLVSSEDDVWDSLNDFDE